MSALLSIARHNNFVHVSTLLICAFVLSGCATPGVSIKSISQGRTKEATIVWPDKPEKARIAFDRSVYRAIDLGINRNAFAKIIDFLSGEREIKLVKPMAVVSLLDDTLFVADPGVGGVHRFSVKNNEHVILRQKNGRPLATPVGLAIGPNNKIYIADSTLGVFVLEPGKDFVTRLKLSLDPRQATGIGYNHNNKQLYVVDTLEHEVKIYDADLALIKGVGKRGLSEGEFNYPTMLWLDSIGRIYVTDSLNFRVQIFAPDGEYLRQFGKIGSATGSQSRPKGVATDYYGHIYIVDSLFHSVQVFNQTGDFLLNFGTQGSSNGQFWLPTGIFVGGNGRTTIYVADPFNRRIQVFYYIGGVG